MAYQNISAELSEDALNKIKEHLKGIADLLPFLITLTSEERQSLYKMGAKSLDFVNDCQMVAQNYANILPNSFDNKEFMKDAKLAQALGEVNLLVDVLASQINDTAMAVGSEAMNTALQVYDYVKTAAKREAGIKTLAEQLKTRFKEQGNRSKEKKSS